jgi:predicted XRE-type DNA-binding protein
MSTIKKGSGNVYMDLQMVDAQTMYVKACLASKIGEIIKQRNLTQQQAAEILGMPQPKLSQLLRGSFRGISEAKMIACLNSLGSDVDIVVSKTHQDFSKGQTQVSFA